MTCYAPLKGWKDPETGGLTFQAGKNRKQNQMEVSCGQCLGCRLDRATMWMARIIHESELHADRGGNCFITLTYDDKQVPEDWSLRKRDFQNFMKRLRRKHPEKKIRFFHVGEYGGYCKHGLPAGNNRDADPQYRCPGCNVGRPHYHALLFNHRYDDLIAVGKKGDHVHYTSPSLEETWTHGITQVGDLTPQSAGYVARYCLKKVNGLQAENHYQNTDPETGEITNVHPEYSTMSRRPGIGRTWFDQYSADIFPSDETPVPGKGILPSVPRYYTEILKEQDPELHEEIKRRREKHKLEHPEEYEGPRLMEKYNVKRAQIEALKREL